MKRSLVLYFCLFGLLSLNGCAFNPVEDGIDEMVKVIESRDGQKIFDKTDEISKTQYGKKKIIDELAEYNEQMSLESAEISDLRFNKKSSDSKKRVYQGKLNLLTKHGSYEGPIEITLVKTQDNAMPWQLSWNRGLNFPELSDSDELGFTSVPASRGKILDRNGNVLAKDITPGVRAYPYGNLTSDVVGFVRKATLNDVLESKAASKDQVTTLTEGTNLGRIGLEKAYQEELSGKNGLKVYFKSNPGHFFIKSAPEAGKDITTTLDIKVQQAGFNQINGEFGAVSVVNPQNGEVLALVSTPTLNLANWSDEVMDVETWERLKASNQTPFEGNFSQTFLPGSTQKLLTSIIGLNNGVITTADNSGYYISGSRWQPDTSWGGYKVNRVTPIEGFINLKTAIIHSDNIFFSRVGLDLGIDKYIAGLKHLGIGEEVPSDLKIYKSRVSNSGEIKSYIALADTSYGQAQNLISPLQMNLYYAAMLNGGDVLVPHFILGQEKKVWKPQITSKENINFINLAFEQVVNVVHPNARRHYARIAGKTGTAEVGADGSVNLGWFCGYDLNNLDLAACIMVNHVENRGGSDVNTGKFGRLFDELYQNNVPYHPKGPVVEPEKKENQQSKPAA